MIFRNFYLLLIVHFYCLSILVSDLKIEGNEWNRNVAPLQYKVRFIVSWTNSWRNDKNYGATWTF